MHGIPRTETMAGEERLFPGTAGPDSGGRRDDGVPLGAWDHEDTLFFEIGFSLYRIERG